MIYLNWRTQMKTANKMNADELLNEVYNLQKDFDNMTLDSYESAETQLLVQRQFELAEHYTELTGLQVFN